MRRALHIQPHLTLITLACFGLASATAYWLLTIPPRLRSVDPDSFVIAASAGGAFAAQCGVFLAIVCPVAAHALSGRWSWSVRILALVSAYWGCGMAAQAMLGYEDAERATGYICTPAQLLEGALTLASVFLFYLRFAGVTLVWIATRGRRFRFGGTSPSNSSLNS